MDGNPDVDDDQKSRNIPHNYNHHIPYDVLISFIFCKLPLSCLFRCTAVCKAWRSLVHKTNDLYQGTSLMTNFALGFVSTATPRFKIIIPHGFNHKNTSPVAYPQIHPDWNFHGASNGFLLYCSVKEKIGGYSTIEHYVCNPLILISVPLPDLHCCLPSEPGWLFSMLIFDPERSRHYEVIAFFGKRTRDHKQEIIFEKVCVFSSKRSDSGWRRLELVYLISEPNEVSSMDGIRAPVTVCVKENAYRLGFCVGDDFASLFRRVILGFHVQEELMELINSPPLMNHNTEILSHELGKAEDSLQYIYYDAQNISIWRLHEDDRSWVLRHQIYANGSIVWTGRDHRPVDLIGSCALTFHRDEEFLYFIYMAHFYVVGVQKEAILNYAETAMGDMNRLNQDLLSHFCVAQSIPNLEGTC